MNQTVTYLQELTAIPSPTGFTREIADYLVKTIEGFGYEVTRTAKGGVNVTVPGVITDKQRYVTAHVDTLGAIVRAVKSPTLLKTPLLMLLVPTSIVNLTNTLLRRPMKKNNLLRKLF